MGISSSWLGTMSDQPRKDAVVIRCRQKGRPTTYSVQERQRRDNSGYTSHAKLDMVPHRAEEIPPTSVLHLELPLES